MIKQKIVELLIEKLVEVQQMSGRELPEITGETKPIGDLPGFDSPNGVEVVMMLEDDFPVPDGSNPFVSDDGKRALTIDEIADRLLVVAAS